MARLTDKLEANIDKLETRRGLIALFSIVVSLVACGISLSALITAIEYRSSPPSVSPYKPTGYAVLRGLFSFPSDHLVIPFEWENSGGTTAIIRHPYLKLHNVTTGEDLEFSLAGEYPEISTEVFEDKLGYQLKRSFLLEPHTVSLKVLVFHISGWWNEEGSLYEFAFDPDDCYEVSLGYQVNDYEPIEQPLFDLVMFDVDRLDADNDWWDFWSLKNVFCDE